MSDNASEVIKQYINKIIHDDCINVLPKLPSNSIDLVLTDPPYFLDKLDDKWIHEKAKPTKYKKQIVNHLPSGMRFDPEQAKRLYEWYLPISKEIMRVLKPGGFFMTFASPRLFHRVACAVEDAGFYLRDTFLWLYTQSQPKAMGLHHFIEKLDLSEEYKNILHEKLNYWKTPQVKSVYEPIIIAQKPYEGTLLKNFIKHKTGLFNTAIKIGENKFPSNILIVEETETILDRYFLIEKDKEKIEHPTTKPVELFQYLIKLSTVEGAVVLDPFVGSGTTAIAAKRTNRKFIGIEINEPYVQIALSRLAKE